MTATTASNNEPLSERHQRKRLAAKVRQQRCRARKREAKMAKASATTRNMDSMKGARRENLPVVRGPVLIQHRNPVSLQPPSAATMMSIPMLHHHPTSPFVLYPRRTPGSFPTSPNATSSLWAANNTNSPTMSVYSRSMRPSHSEIMARSSLALGMYKSPTSTLVQLSPLRHLQIPRVSPVPDISKMAIPVLPDFCHLERKEETAIDAMLSLHRSGSKSED